MKSVIISYEKISPSVLATAITSRCCNAIPMYKDIDEDYFEMEICGWLPLTAKDLATIEKILAPYV